MKIHFVCSGNTNRSRMAEAYLRSKKIAGLEVSSSGIYATHNENGPLSNYARIVLQEEELLPFAATSWHQTSKELLEQNDLIVFMGQKHCDFCRDTLQYVPENYIVWDIGDVPSTHPGGDTLKQKIQKTIQDETIFATIVRHVDKLVSDLKL